MSYLVFCTFDLKSASSQNYQTAYADLRNMGLSRVQKGSGGGEIVIPTTSVMGSFEGRGPSEVRQQVLERIKAAFAARGFRSEIFLVVGGNWAWGSATT